MALKVGKLQIYHPFHELRNNDGKYYYPTEDVKEMIFSEYRKAGYVVQFHLNHDPGDPRSSDYYTIRW